MKKENKILFLIVLFCLFAILIIESTSFSSFYRDPYMFRHLAAAEFIQENKSINISDEDYTNFLGREFVYSNRVLFFPVPVLLPVVLNILSGLGLNFLFNHFFFLLLIVALVFFVLFRELFNDSGLALGLSLIVVLFPFEPVYYKITSHGWFFVRIFSAMALYFLIKFLKKNDSVKSKNMFFLLFFSFLGLYSDKSAVLLVFFSLILFFVVYFYFERKSILNKNFLNSFVLFFFILLIFSFLGIYRQFAWNLDVIIFNLTELNFVPSFIFPNLPFSEFYLKKDLFYVLFRYLLPVLTVLSLIILNLNKIKSFALKNSLIKTFFVSKIIFYLITGFGMLFSFAFISSRGASMIFLFLSFVCLIGLHQMKKSLAKYSLISVFFILVLIFPLLFYTQTPQYNYEQFNDRHLSAMEFIESNFNEDANFYSDVKMAKLIKLKTSSETFNAKTEFNYSMINEIIPIYFDKNISLALSSLELNNSNYLLLTEEMSSLMVQPANELLMPATELSKFDSSENFDKIFENKQARLYKINFD